MDRKKPPQSGRIVRRHYPTVQTFVVKPDVSHESRLTATERRESEQGKCSNVGLLAVVGHYLPDALAHFPATHRVKSMRAVKLNRSLNHESVQARRQLILTRESKERSGFPMNRKLSSCTVFDADAGHDDARPNHPGTTAHAANRNYQ